MPEKDVEPTRLTDGEALEAYLREQQGAVHPKLDDRWLEQKGCARAAYLPPAGAS